MPGFVERRGPRRWRARYRGPDRRERSRTFERKIDAERWLSGIQVAMTRGEWNDPARARLPLGDWSRQWLASRQPTLKATTLASYRSLLEVCILPTWERIPLAAVTHGDVTAWVAGLAGAVGASRCRKAAILLSGILEAAVRDQRLSRNPCDGVPLPRLPEQRQRFLTLDQLSQLAVEAGEYRLMVLVLGVCGLRFGECVALRVESIDSLRSRLLVTASVSEVGGRQVWSTPKSHRSREVPVPRSLMAELVELVDGRGPRDLLFPSPSGTTLRSANWRRRVWAGAILRVGLPGLRPHDLRHTAASLAIGSGASVKHVQRMLGHKDAAMTLNVYASLFEDDLDDVSARLDQALSKAAAASVRPGSSSGGGTGREPGPLRAV
jgi:integrase